ncbi:MAG: hypothetical protein M3T55_02250 [Pseudomonadota bacterium]|nr:hypothetical protein [Pseudomonadota bacterium]
MLDRLLMAAAVAALSAVAAAQTVARAQSVQVLTNPPPDGAQLTFLLTDGTVLAQGAAHSDRFDLLTPDNTGSYVNGTWKRVGNLPTGYSPSAMASAVLADGRVLIEGGEYNFGNFALTNLGAIYDPILRVWSSVAPPKGWQNIGDSPAVVLPNGNFLLGDKLDMRVAELDPKTLAWSELGVAGKLDFNAEEGWTLLPDGSVLTVDVLAHPQSEEYNPGQGLWIGLGSTVADLAGPPCCTCIRYPPHNKCYRPPGETGPGILRPDGTVFATGATPRGGGAGHTSIYTPGSGWAAGPNFPNGDDAGDNFAALLTNGDVLVQGSSGHLYDFNGAAITDTGVNGGGGLLMLLPTGQVLVNGTEVYNSPGTYKMAWQPTISNSPSKVTRGSTYQISGTQFNGLSQANAFGDELQIATNYPLVRITNAASKHVFYARTHDHSTMGVATGAATVSTNFDVPLHMERGAGSLVVIANGIPSNPVSIIVR